MCYPAEHGRSALKGVQKLVPKLGDRWSSARLKREA